MSWAKRNLYFLVSGIVAVVLLGAAGWYCYSSWQSNSANGDKLKGAYDQLSNIAKKPVGAGNDKVNNIEAAKEQTKEVKTRVAEMEKFFAPVRGIPNTNHFEDRVLSSAVRDTIAQLRAAAQSHSVLLPGPEFAFSFSLQAGKITYDPSSGPALAGQLGEIKTICDTLYASRIIALDSIQRERTADDANLTYAANGGSAASGNYYCDSYSMTNDNIVITPYQVTFQCFTPELGGVISSFANQPHTIIVKTLNLQPSDMSAGSYGGYTAGGYTGAGVYPGSPYATAGQFTAARGSVPSAIDEKKLKVTMLLDFVKIVPAQGR